MSYAPQPLLDLRQYLRSHTELPWAALGIVGDTAHTYGYHLGRDRIFGSRGLGHNDYSVEHPRDRAGLTNGASANDTGNFSHLVELTMWAVKEARAGRRPDTREIIGPWSDGRAYRFDALNGWRAEIRARGDSHETHMHESWFRDSEHRDKIRFYRPFFEGAGEDEGDGMALPKLGDEGGHVAYWQRRLNRLGASPELEVDGVYGPKMQAAVTASRKAYGYQDPGRAEITGWHAEQMDADVAKKYAGKDGKDGVTGPPGPPGSPGALPAEIRITGTATVVPAGS